MGQARKARSRMDDVSWAPETPSIIVYDTWESASHIYIITVLPIVRGTGQVDD